MIKCVIFDLDDTLFLTEEAAFHLENTVAAKMDFAPMTRAAHKADWGGKLPEVITARVRGINAGDFMKVFDQTMPEFVKNGLIDSLSDENLEVLDTLRAGGLTVLVLSSRTHPELKHLLNKRHDLYSRVEAFYYSDNLEFMKPDPRVFDLILNTHNLQPSECVYVGDSVTDAQAAKSRGLYFIASLESELRRKKDFDGLEVDAFIKKLPDALQVIKDLDAKEVAAK